MQAVGELTHSGRKDGFKTCSAAALIFTSTTCKFLLAYSVFPGDMCVCIPMHNYDDVCFQCGYKNVHMHLLRGPYTHRSAVCLLCNTIKSDLHCVSVSVNTQKEIDCVCTAVFGVHTITCDTVNFVLVQTDCLPW